VGVDKVYIIYNDSKFSKDNIIYDIKQEGYKHFFFFPKDREKEFNLEFLKSSKEVWVFGECEDMPDYKLAVELGLDIWRMG